MDGMTLELPLFLLATFAGALVAAIGAAALGRAGWPCIRAKAMIG